MKKVINTSNITIGSDPEFFITTDSGEAYPSTNLLSGTKANPDDIGDGYAMLKDNVLIEGNIPPAKTKSEFVKNMQNLKESINILLTMNGLKLFSADSMEYRKEYLEDPEANEFGCSAYKNGWEVGSFSAEDMSSFPKRVAGFHIHIGYEVLNKSIPKGYLNRLIARAYDYFVVLPARLHFNDEFRSKYYGNFGVYRDCSYGIECRALGGHFTDDKYLEWVYENTIKALEFCSIDENLEKLKKIEAPTMNLEETSKNYKILNVDINSLLIKELEHEFA